MKFGKVKQNPGILFPFHKSNHPLVVISSVYFTILHPKVVQVEIYISLWAHFLLNLISYVSINSIKNPSSLSS